MKIERKILTIILLTLIIFAGCNKDKKESTLNNYINYDGKMYSIDKGVIENFGSWDEDEAYYLELTLLSNGVTVIESSGEITGYGGDGNGIHFEMYSNSSTQLANGNYDYDEWSWEAGTFDYGWIMLNYDESLDYAEVDQDIEGGTVTVSKTGDIYKITINCTDEDGISVTGHFNGTLKYYDSSNKKSTSTDKRKF